VRVDTGTLAFEAALLRLGEDVLLLAREPDPCHQRSGDIVDIANTSGISAVDFFTGFDIGHVPTVPLHVLLSPFPSAHPTGFSATSQKR
jgi:hypothetical protein